jgi:hypothetical protein
MSEGGASLRRPARAEGWTAFAIFCGVACAVAGVYLASAGLLADLSVFGAGRVRLARFNAALGLVLAYVCASLWLGQRWARRDLDELRGVVEGGEAEWAGWAERVATPRVTGLLGAALLGGLVGGLVDLIGGRASYDTTGIWHGHVVWVWILNPVLFALMGVLVRMSALRARLYQELGRRARVRIGDIAPLAPFVRAGMRIALLWFLGTSLACLLLVDTDAPALVLSVLLVTTAIALASLLAPSRGVHERLREAKRAELAWLRVEIARSTEALRRGDAAAANTLPALLAWEARVADSSEWPFDASTWLRFALLLLVPIGSWLGGALVEHVVERWLGA